MTTPQFKDWFGPSLVTETGEAGGKPLVVYHGTDADFNEFDGRLAGKNFKTGGQKGFFFSASPAQASAYGSAVMPVFLRLLKPLVHRLSDDEESPPDVKFDRLKKSLYSRAEKGGHDGIVVTNYVGSNGQDQTLYVVFHPEQIKSAIGNNGDFNADNQDIRFSMPETTQSVAHLQAELAAIEGKYEPLRMQRLVGSPQWEAVSKEAGAVRQKLFDLTGDYYGRPKVKVQRPSDEALEAEYQSPDDVPADVQAWIEKNASLLTSDATDAVRWGRIRDTLNDDRYPEGGLTIYRAVSNGDEIRVGDWVTTDRAYAEVHLAKHLKGEGTVLEETVDGQDVLTSPTGNDEEAIFAPRHLSGPKAADSDAALASSKHSAPDDWARALPRTGASVDGRMVRAHVPNRSSIEASIANAEVLPGVRSIPLAAFDYKPGDPDQRTLKLAAEIEESEELNPLIVGIDGKGPYVIEGGHRLDALYVLKAMELPAVVVIDLDEFSDKPMAPDKSTTPAFKNWFGPSVITETGRAGGRPLPVYHGTGTKPGAEPFFTFEHRTDGDGRFDMYLPAGEKRGGFYFTPREDEADNYARGAAMPDGTPRVIAAYISIKNPYWAREEEFSFYVTQADIDRLEGEGFDGVVKMAAWSEGRISQAFQIIAFHPQQIKLAKDNNGDFDVDNQDMRFSVPDEEDVQNDYPAP